MLVYAWKVWGGSHTQAHVCRPEQNIGCPDYLGTKPHQTRTSSQAGRPSTKKLLGSANFHLSMIDSGMQWCWLLMNMLGFKLRFKLTEQSSCSWPRVSPQPTVGLHLLKNPAWKLLQGVGRWLSGQEHWFTFLRTHVQFQNLHGCSQLSVTPVAGDLIHVCMHASISELDSTENWVLLQKLSAVSLECCDFLVTCNPIVTTRKIDTKYTQEKLWSSMFYCEKN